MLLMLMTRFFEVSLPVSAVVLIVALLFPVLNRYFTAKWRYMLWLVLAVRLLVPFRVTMPEPPVNINIPAAQTIVYTLPAADINADEYILPDGNTGEDIITDEIGSLSVSDDVKAITLMEVFSYLWLAGIIFYLTWQLMSYVRFLLFIRRFAQPASDRPYALLRTLIKSTRADVRIAIAICPGILSPMATGLLRTVLLLPHEDYTDTELELIIRHELMHYRRGDIPFKLLIMLVRAVYWYNPLIWLMTRYANRDLELSCDEAVVRGMDKEKRGHYGDVILSNIRAQKVNAISFTTYFHGGGKTIAARLKHLFDARVKRSGYIVLTLIVSLTLIAGTFVACQAGPMTESSSGSSDLADSSLQSSSELPLYSPLSEMAQGELYPIGKDPAGIFPQSSFQTTPGDDNLLQSFIAQLTDEVESFSQQSAIFYVKTNGEKGAALRYSEIKEIYRLIADIASKLTVMDSLGNPATGGSTFIDARDALDRRMWSISFDGHWFSIYNGGYKAYNMENAANEALLIGAILSAATAQSSSSQPAPSSSSTTQAVTSSSAQTSSQQKTEQKPAEPVKIFAIVKDIDTDIDNNRERTSAVNDLYELTRILGSLNESELTTLKLCTVPALYTKERKLSAVEVASFYMMISSLSPEIGNPDFGNPPTGGGWKIYWQGGRTGSISWNGQSLLWEKNNETIQFRLRDDCGIGKYIHQLTGGANSSTWQTYKGLRITEMYAQDTQNYSYHAIDKAYWPAAEGMLEYFEGSNEIQDRAIVVFTEDGKFTLHLDKNDTRARGLIRLCDSSIKTSPRLVRWFAFMSPDKITRIRFGSKDVTDPVKLKPMIDFLRGKLTVMSAPQVFNEELNPVTVTSLYTMTIDFESGVSYKIHGYDDSICVYATDLKKSISYRTDKSQIEALRKLAQEAAK